MKLYAKIKSERAEKGQGGNDYLQIQLQNEKQAIFGSIVVLPGLYTYGSIHGNKFEFSLSDTIKAKQCDKCKQAGWKACCNLSEEWHKAKRQKGERLHDCGVCPDCARNT